MSRRTNATLLLAALAPAMAGGCARDDADTESAPAGGGSSAGLASPVSVLEDPVLWEANAAREGDEVSAVAPGGTMELTVSATIADGWYIYSITQGEGGPVPTNVALAPDQPFLPAGTLSGPAPTARFDRNFDMEVETHVGSVVYVLPVQASPEAPPGLAELGVRVRYQACTDRVCLPAQTVNISVSVGIQAGE